MGSDSGTQSDGFHRTVYGEDLRRANQPQFLFIFTSAFEITFSFHKSMAFMQT